MGEPAVPTEAERTATLELARGILEAIRNDEWWPFPFYERSDPTNAARTAIFRLAQDLVDARAEVEAVRRAWVMCEQHNQLLQRELEDLKPDRRF